MKRFCRLYYRVPFSETDAMKIVHHSNHARYLERGRIEFLRLINLGYNVVMNKGMHFPVTELKIEFKRPLVFDEVVLIETEITELTRTRLNFTYKLFSAPEVLPSSLESETFPGQAKVLGDSYHCCVNDNGRPIAIAPEILSQLNNYFGGAHDHH